MTKLLVALLGVGAGFESPWLHPDGEVLGTVGLAYRPGEDRLPADDERAPSRRGMGPSRVRVSAGRGVRARLLRLRGGGPARLPRGGTRTRGPGGGRDGCRRRGAATSRRRRLRGRCGNGLGVGLRGDLRGGLASPLGDLRRAVLDGGGHVGGLLADQVGGSAQALAQLGGACVEVLLGILPG